MADVTKSRNFMMLLYPDCDEHKNAISMLCAENASWVLHDKDTDTKPHIHAVVTFPNPRSITGVASSYELDLRFIKACKSTSQALRYLIHKDDKDKYQYSIDEVQGNADRVRKACKDREDTTRDIIALFDYIDSDKYANMRTVFRWCVEHDMVDLYRRNNVMIRNYLKG